MLASLVANALPQNALSVPQPRAWLVINGWKPVENRTWATKFRGPILIHAGQKFDPTGYEDILMMHPNIPLPGTPGRDTAPTGNSVASSLKPR
jgi:hypothetical protein